MMELKTDVCAVVDESGRRREFRYFLLVEQVEAGRFACENYGVRVEEADGESVSVPGLTTSAPRVQELLAQLARCQVGPASLRDVVDDWL